VKGVKSSIYLKIPSSKFQIPKNTGITLCPAIRVVRLGIWGLEFVIWNLLKSALFYLV